MPRLIDADALIDAMPKVDPLKDEKISKVGAIADILCLIFDQPTVDPVIHCRDCVHWKTYNSSCPMMYEEWFDDEDDGLDIVTRDNTPEDGSGFCHMAKKKENENETD